MTNAEWAKQVAATSLAKAIANVTLVVQGGYITEALEEFLKSEKTRLVMALREMDELTEADFHGYTASADFHNVAEYFSEKHAVITNYIIDNDGWCEDAIIRIWHAFTFDTSTSRMVYRHYFQSGVVAELSIKVPTGIKNHFGHYCHELWRKRFICRKK